MSEQQLISAIPLKESISKRTNNGELFIQFVANELGIPLVKKDSNSYEKTFNGFYDDGNPDLSFYRKNNKWYFNDFGSNNEGEEFKGDYFQFGFKFYDLHEDRFNELLQRMDRDITMNFDFGHTMVKKPIKEKYKNRIRKKSKSSSSEEAKNLQHELMIVEPTDSLKKYYSQYGINISDFNNVNQIKGLRYLNEDGTYNSSTIFKNYENRLHVAYSSGKFSKIYCIDPKRFWSVGKKVGEYTFGVTSNAKYENEPLFLVGGEKDTMTVISKGYAAFCLSSETVMPSQRLIKEIYEEKFRLVILYDNDEAGKAAAKKIHQKWDYPIADLSTIIPKDCRFHIKDISDYIKYKLCLKTLTDYLDSFKGYKEVCISVESAKEQNNAKTVEEPIVIAETKTETKIEATKEITEAKGTSDEVYNGIPQKVYDKLPELLKDVVYPITKSHQKDLVLLSALVVLSNIFKVKGVYFNKTVYSNLFLFVTASAAAGKGVLQWDKKLGDGIHKHLYKMYKEELALYKKLDKAEQSETERPRKPTFFIPGNASSASLIRQLYINNGFGVILESEADAINAVLDKEWGNLSDIFRRAFEFESITMLRSDDENSFEIEEPRLSMVLTGTQQQLLKLIPNSENGLFSRFMFLEFPLIKEWNDPFENGIDFNEHYNQISNKLLDYYISNKDYFEVIYTKSQQQILFNKFQKYEKYYDGLLGEDIIASIRRIGNMHFRISMLLTAIRLMDEKTTGKVHCSDVDFETANELINVALDNLKKIYGYLPKTAVNAKKLHRKQTLLYEGLNNEFTFDDVRTKSAELQIPIGTAEGYLRVFIRHQLIERIEKGKYIKIKL